PRGGRLDVQQELRRKIRIARRLQETEAALDRLGLIGRDRHRSGAHVYQLAEQPRAAVPPADEPRTGEGMIVHAIVIVEVRIDGGDEHLLTKARNEHALKLTGEEIAKIATDANRRAVREQEKRSKRAFDAHRVAAGPLVRRPQREQRVVIAIENSRKPV